MILRSQPLFTLCLSVLFFLGGNGPAFSESERVQGKLGIQIRSGDQVRRAKSRDRLMAGDLLRVYVQPEKPAFIYVVHTDDKTATLLTSPKPEKTLTALVMPSLEEHYEVDGASQRESITVLFGPEEIREIRDLFHERSVEHGQWADIAAALLEKGKIDMGEPSKKPFSIAGNVRGAGSQDSDPFLKELQRYSGQSILVKKYEFRVKQ